MEKACKNYMEARRGGETDQQNAITHKGGVTRSNFSRNGVALKVDETCCNFLKIRHFALKVFETISKTRNALPS